MISRHTYNDVYKSDKLGFLSLSFYKVSPDMGEILSSSSRSEGRRPERSEVNKFVGPSRPERS